ncbi:hypothetical protein J6590_091223 [Homalodisca vitripennis]|nr:hypothetical protein J6590_091223 [Homalodisca vitripennis]
MRRVKGSGVCGGESVRGRDGRAKGGRDGGGGGGGGGGTALQVSRATSASSVAAVEALSSPRASKMTLASCHLPLMWRCIPRSLVPAIRTLHRVLLVTEVRMRRSGVASPQADPCHRNASRQELGCHFGDVADVAISLDHNRLKRYGVRYRKWKRDCYECVVVGGGEGVDGAAGEGAGRGVLTPSRELTSRQRGANSAHGHGPGTELAPPDYKGVLIQRMDMTEALN